VRPSRATDAPGLPGARRNGRRGILGSPLGLLVAALVAVLVGAGAYVPATLLAPLPAATAQFVDVAPERPPAAQLVWPGYGSGQLSQVGRVEPLGAYGSTEPQPMASITKLVTAAVVLEARPLAVGEEGPAIAFDADDVAIRQRHASLNGRVAPVRAGLELSQRQVMELALVRSANNYAESLAVWAYGSVDGYLAAARDWLAGHDLQLTVVDPTGLSFDNTGTPAEIVELGEAVLADPVVAELVQEPAVDVPGVGVWQNSNTVLGISGVDGLKTGTLDDWGANLLFSSRRTVGDETVVLVGVVLGGPDHDVLRADVPALLESAYGSFSVVRLSTDGEVVGRYTTAWGDPVDLVATRDVEEVVYSDAPVAAQATSEPVEHGRAGDEVGELFVSAAGESARVPLELAGAVGEPDAWWRLTHPVAAAEAWQAAG